MPRVWVPDNSRVGFGGAAPEVSILSGVAQGMMVHRDREQEAIRKAIANRLTEKQIAQTEQRMAHAEAAEAFAQQHRGLQIEQLQLANAGAQLGYDQAVEDRERWTSLTKQSGAIKDAAYRYLVEKKGWEPSAAQTWVTVKEGMGAYSEMAELMAPPSEQEQLNLELTQARINREQQLVAKNQQEEAFFASPQFAEAMKYREAGLVDEANRLGELLVAQFPMVASEIRAMFPPQAEGITQYGSFHQDVATSTDAAQRLAQNAINAERDRLMQPFEGKPGLPFNQAMEQAIRAQVNSTWSTIKRIQEAINAPSQMKTPSMNMELLLNLRIYQELYRRLLDYETQYQINAAKGRAKDGTFGSLNDVVGGTGSGQTGEYDFETDDGGNIVLRD